MQASDDHRGSRGVNGPEADDYRVKMSATCRVDRIISASQSRLMPSCQVFLKKRGDGIGAAELLISSSLLADDDALQINGNRLTVERGDCRRSGSAAPVSRTADRGPTGPDDDRQTGASAVRRRAEVFVIVAELMPIFPRVFVFETSTNRQDI